MYEPCSGPTHIGCACITHLHVAHERVLTGRVLRHAGGVWAVQRDETQAQGLQRSAEHLSGIYADS